jgi:hypothetical protein
LDLNLSVNATLDLGEVTSTATSKVALMFGVMSRVDVHVNELTIERVVIPPAEQVHPFDEREVVIQSEVQ